MGSRTWIKIYCDKWLNGTIREESLEVRAVWIDLLVLAGSGKYGDSGEVKITDNIGFLDQQLADLLQISTRKWKIISKRLQETDRICISQNNVIAIKNWAKYQSEYERTKAYRIGDIETKSTAESTKESTEKSTAREERGERGEGRLEIIEEENTPSLYNLSPSKEDVIDFYRDKVGDPSEDMENELNLAATKYSTSWVIDAIQEAVKRGKKDWRYIARILENWRRFGKNTKNKQDPDKYSKGKYGHCVLR